MTFIEAVTAVIERKGEAYRESTVNNQYSDKQTVTTILSLDLDPDEPDDYLTFLDIKNDKGYDDYLSVQDIKADDWEIR